jgi:hypoxanthine phosphoribosyltransferase
VLVVEDIIDSGLTLARICEELAQQKPASLAVAALLNKSQAQQKRIDHADRMYIGFECPLEFVVGYGLDYAQHYRNLPYIGVLKPEIYR